MKTLTLILAVLLGAVAESPAQTDLIARIHFLGGKKISADTNRLAFTNEFCSTEARVLENQTLDKLSRAPGVWFKSRISAGAGDGSAQLRPLLDDLLTSEWIFEMRDTTNGSPEYAVAIRLDKNRAEVWSKNLAAVLQNWTGSTVVSDESGVWELKKHEPPNLIRFKRDGDFVVVDCGQNELSLGGIAKSAPETNWLSADLDWPRLTQVFPALKEFDFPKIQMQVAGRGSNLMFNGKFTLAQPLPAPEKWRIPTNTIHQPFISFTAARGAGSWLARQPWMRRFKLQPQPDQLFIWAQPQIAFQTFAAEPVPDAHAALKQIENNFSSDTNWQSRLISTVKLNVSTNEIAFGIPFFAPSIRAVRESSGDFLVGGFFPNSFKPTPLPPDLLAHLNQPNLVYYHWEITSERLKVIPQLSQLLLMLTRHEQLDQQSAAYKWLEQIGPTLSGTAVTEVTQTAPTELAFSRRAPGGLTGLELRAFASWLEAANFPGCDLNMPARPAMRNRPGSAMPGMLPPPPAPSPPNAK